MASTTIRISEHARDVLRRVAKEKGISLVEALDDLTTEWEKRQFFLAFNESFAALKSDEKAWQEELNERRLWDGTLSDDLEND